MPCARLENVSSQDYKNIIENIALRNKGVHLSEPQVGKFCKCYLYSVHGSVVKFIKFVPDVTSIFFLASTQLWIHWITAFKDFKTWSSLVKSSQKGSWLWLVGSILDVFLLYLSLLLPLLDCRWNSSRLHEGFDQAYLQEWYGKPRLGRWLWVENPTQRQNHHYHVWVWTLLLSYHPARSRNPKRTLMHTGRCMCLDLDTVLV
jgi:hypothetical protein